MIRGTAEPVVSGRGGLNTLKVLVAVREAVAIAGFGAANAAVRMAAQARDGVARI